MPCALLLALALLPAVTWADFAAAVADFEAARYSSAHEEFERLAALGDGPSQFNLGAMYLKGQGVERNPGLAVGLLQAAARNGYEKLTPDKLAAMAAALGPEDRLAAQHALEQYGPEALLRTSLPKGRSTGTCRSYVPAHVIRRKKSTALLQEGRENTLIVGSVIVGVDGLARDPEVLFVSTRNEFLAERSRRGLDQLFLGARYSPSMVDGHPVAQRMAVTLRSEIIGDNADWTQQMLGHALTKARAGDPQGQYAIGIVATTQHLNEVPNVLGEALLLKAAQGGYGPAQYEIGRKLLDLEACADIPRGLMWLRAAAHEHSGPAQIAVAEQLLRGEPSPEQVEEATQWLHVALESNDGFALRHAVGLLATHPKLAPADARLLVASAQHLLASEAIREPQTLEAAAAAFAAAGQYGSAVDRQQTALKIARSYAWNTKAVEERLASYRATQPWRGELFAVPPRDTPAPDAD